MNEFISIIVLGAGMNDELLLQSVDGEYYFPTADVADLESNNIVEGAIECANAFGVIPAQTGLRYVVKDGDDITYYFVMFTEDTSHIIKECNWISKANENISNEYYRESFIAEIADSLQNGWIMGDIKVINYL